MPIYEYVCTECNSEFELLVFDRQASVSCPQCGSGRAGKSPSVFAHKGDSGIKSSAGESACAGCSASSCKGCSG